MFTGLIESLGCVLENKPLLSGRRLRIESPLTDIKVGESIAVNGVCLTVLPGHDQGLVFDVSPETLSKTTLGAFMPGQSVHLEQALLAGSRMGGHYVSGHVDTTACIHSRHSVGDFLEITVSDFLMDPTPYLLPKGSITLDGVSLTINAIDQGRMTVMLVPHTLAMTTLDDLSVGQRVNVEFDYLTRIISHQLTSIISHTKLIEVLS